MPVERRDPAVCNDSNKKEGKGEMTKAPICLQDLRGSLYVKAKAEPTWKVGLPIYTTGYTEERIGHSPHEESTYRRLTGGNARWALRRWKTKSYSKPW